MTLALLCLLLIASATLSLLYTSDRTLNFLAQQYFNSDELAISDIKGAALHLDRLQIESLHVAAPSYTADLAGLSVSYSLKDLFAGKLHIIVVDELGVNINSDSRKAGTPRAATVSQSDSLEAMIALAANQPFDELTVHKMTAYLPEGKALEQINGAFSLSNNPPSMSGQFNWESMPALTLAVSSSISTSEPLAMTVELTSGSTVALQSEVALIIEQNNLDINAFSQLDIQQILAFGIDFNLLPPINSTVKNLQINSSLTVRDMLTSPILQSFDVVLNNQERSLQAAFEYEDLPIDIQLALPLHIQSSDSVQQEFFRIETASLDITTAGEVDDMLFDARVEASNLRARCQQPLRCTANATLSADSTNNKGQSWSAQALNFQGPVDLSFSNEDIELTGQDAQVTLKAGVFADADSSFSSTLRQWQIEKRQTQPIRAQAQFELNTWEMNYADYALNKPLASGSLSIVDDTLSASINSSINTEFKLNGQVNANLVTGNGNLSFSMPTLTLSQNSPLSSYFTGPTPDYDIIAGELKAEAAISWRAESDGTLSMLGPLSVDAANITGTYEDSYFLGFTTNLEAEFTNPPGLRTAGVQTANIRTTEIGLAINDIAWGYEFDSSNSTLAIYDLTGSLLGGKVTVPQAKFQDFTSDTELTVVISDLDLGQITALADYPELQVQGFVSGYLPVSLRSGVITMQDGLVSALNPGGSIKYTPLSPSTNASIKVVNQALSNYQFKSLDSELIYDELGDLNMQVKLRGGNPDMAGGQQINLNLGVMNNVPDMLESLRASRSISDVLERNLQRRK